ncbi:MAG: hypothetical protein AAF517_18525, partial [Planctomycetota bacterium]
MRQRSVEESRDFPPREKIYVLRELGESAAKSHPGGVDVGAETIGDLAEREAIPLPEDDHVSILFVEKCDTEACELDRLVSGYSLTWPRHGLPSGVDIDRTLCRKGDFASGGSA